MGGTEECKGVRGSIFYTQAGHEALRYRPQGHLISSRWFEQAFRRRVAWRLAALLPMLAAVRCEAYAQSINVCLRDTTNRAAIASSIEQIQALGGEPNALRRGTIQLQLARSGIEEMYDRAARSFRSALDHDSTCALAWEGLGVAELANARRARTQPLNLGIRVGSVQTARGLAALRKALALAPGMAEAAFVLAQASEATGDSSDVMAALPLLRRADSAASRSDTLVSLWRGRIEEAGGQIDSAAAAFARYLDLGGSRALGSAELTRAKMLLGDTAEAESYYQAVGSGDPAATEVIRGDLDYIAPDSVLERFEEADPGRREALVRQFWQSRDNEELRPAGARIVEHLQRLLFARQHFRLTGSKRFYTPRDAYRGRSVGLDDRGVVYVRLGRPDLRLQPTIVHAMPNETWVYRRPEGDLLLHFSSGGDTPRVAAGDKFDYGGDLSDYHLVNSVMDLHGAQDAPRDILLASRDSASDVYRKMATYLPTTAAQFRLEERRIGARSVRIATTTDDNRLRFSHALRADAEIAAVGTTAEGGLVHLVLAVVRPGEALWSNIRIRFALVGADGSLVARVDTTVPIPAAATAAGQWVFMRIPIAAPDGKWNAHLALSVGDSLGIILSPGELSVTSRQTPLSLSSLVLEDAFPGLPWPAADGDTVRFTPFNSAAKDSRLQVFYEVYGARPGTVYSTRISMSRLRANNELGTSSRMTVSFHEAAHDTPIRVHRDIDLHRMAAGEYVVQVSVSGPQGASASRAKLIVIH